MRVRELVSMLQSMTEQQDSEVLIEHAAMGGDGSKRVTAPVRAIFSFSKEKPYHSQEPDVFPTVVLSA